MIDLLADWWFALIVSPLAKITGGDTHAANTLATFAAPVAAGLLLVLLAFMCGRIKAAKRAAVRPV